MAEAYKNLGGSTSGTGEAAYMTVPAGTTYIIKSIRYENGGQTASRMYVRADGVSTSREIWAGTAGVQDDEILVHPLVLEAGDTLRFAGVAGQDFLISYLSVT